MENSDHVISPRHQRTGADTAQLPSQPDLNVIDSETSASLGHFDSNAKLNATSSSEEKDHSLEDPTKNNVSKRWKTTLLRIGPLAGICSLMLAVLSILVSLAVLMGSRGDSVASWDVPPSSWLAVCTAVGNQAIRFAAFQGVAIAWWMSASRGSTLGRLHSDCTHTLRQINAQSHLLIFSQGTRAHTLSELFQLAEAWAGLDWHAYLRPW